MRSTPPPAPDRAPRAQSVLVRSARPDEAAPLAELMERTFRDTYAHNSSERELEKYVPDHFSPAHQARELADPALRTLIAESREGGEAEPVAFAQLRLPGDRPAPPCVAARRPAELSRFYVDRPWHGRGVAAPLMDACVALATESGADALWLLVYRINDRAIAFYRKCGFAPVGTAVFRFGDELHDDVVMMRPLAPPAPLG